MLAFAEPGVDRPAREQTALRVLACLAALDGLLQPPACILVVGVWGATGAPGEAGAVQRVKVPSG